MTNQECWFLDKKYWGKWDVECGKRPNIEKIVAEAERQGQLQAWEQAKTILAGSTEFTNDGTWVNYAELEEKMEAEINKLKPV